MNKFLKLYKQLIKAGSITDEQKKEFEGLVSDLSKEERETLADEIKAVNALEAKGGEDEEVEKLLEKIVDEKGENNMKKLRKEISEFLEEQKELMKKEIGVYSKEAKKDREITNKWLKEFGKALYSGNDAKVKELTTDATGSPYGGYVVDSELSAEIRHLMTEYGVARREMTTFQLSKGDLKANDLVTDVSVNWTDEASAILSSQVVLGQETLALKKLTAIVTLTNELLEDQEVDLFSFIASRVAEGFAQKEDEAFFKGDGTSTYGGFTGLLNNTSTNSVTMAGTTFASIDADDLIDMKDATPQGALANGKYYLHRTIMSYIRKLKDSQNEYIYQRPSESGPGTIWGDPVVLVEAMPSKTDTAANTAFVLYGDLKKACILGYKGAIKAKRFDAGVVRNVANDGDINLITTDREAIRWTQRTGFITIIPTAVTRLLTAAASA